MPEQPDRARSRDQVITLLRTFGGEWTPTAIAQALDDTTRQRVQNLVRRMTADGELVTDGDGRYWITEATIRRSQNRPPVHFGKAAPMPPVVADHVTHLRRRNLRESTIMQRRQVLTRLNRWLEEERGSSLIAATPEELVMFCDFPHGIEGRRNVIMHLSGFYRWAHEFEALLEFNPARKLVRPRAPEGDPRPMPEDRVAVALHSAPDPLRTWLLLGAYCGLRACEIAPIRRDDVDVKRRLLHVIGKGGKPRTLPMPEVVLDVVEPLTCADGRWFFPKGRGYTGHVTPNQLQKRANAYLRGMGISDSFHSLRHRYATMVYEHSGFDLRLTQSLLGHASPSTTAIYTKIRSDAASEVVGRLPVHNAR